MRSGEVAAEAGVNVETLRYYERRGLLREPERLESGYRAYPPQAVGTVRFIKRAQELGFSLAEVDQLLELAAGGPDGCDAVQDLARRKLDEFDRKIATLGAMRASLQRLVDTCTRPRSERECPLLQSIEGETRPGRLP